MANLDPTGILSSIASLAVQQSVAEIYNQFYYNDRLEELLKHLIFLEEVERSLRESSTFSHDPELSFLSQLQDWTIKTRKVCNKAEQQSCICHLKKRRSIFNAIKLQLEELDQLRNRASFLVIFQGTLRELPQETMSSPSFQPVPAPSQLVGVDHRLDLLSENVLNNSIPGNKWIGLCAMGGAGKTLLAQLFFNSTKADKHFEERFWITVSRGRRVEMLQEELLMQMEKREFNVGHKADGKSTIFNRLQGKRVLLILDDVWSYSVLEWLDVVDESCGSKILVTTRNQRVLNHVEARQISFKLLNERESWGLFYLSSGLGRVDKSSSSPELLHTAWDISRQCKGLPLALKVIGKAMLGKTKLWQWGRTLQKLRRASQLDREEEEALYEVLKVSFEELGEVNDRGAKYQECFLGMAAFPEDDEVPEKEVFRTWKPVVPDEEEALEIAQQLKDRCLIQASVRSRAFPLLPDTTHFKIHDVLRDLALRILSYKTENRCMFAAGRAMTQGEFEETISHENDLSEVHKVSLQDNQITGLSPINIKAPNLKVLLLDGNRHLKNIPGDLFENLSNLQVLTCTRTPIQEWPESLGGLKELRVLEAFGLGVSSGIRLGDISALKKLEFLHTNFYISRDCNFLADFTSLRHLSIEEYFVSLSSSCFTTLVNLETIDLNLEDVSSIAPALYTFRRLTMLRLWYKGEETLDFWLGIFKYSVHLEFLCLRNGNEYQPAFSLAQLPAKLPKLKVVYLNNPWLTSLPGTLGEPQGFPELQILDLKCKALQVLPELKTGSLTKLSTLTILDTVVMENLPQSWTRLTNLEMLELRGCRSFERILPQDIGLLDFQKLRSLDLSGTRITSIPEALLQLPLLRYLDIRGCRRLQLGNLDVFGKTFVAHSGLNDDQLKNQLQKSGLHVDDTLACALEHQQHVKTHA